MPDSTPNRIVSWERPVEGGQAFYLLFEVSNGYAPVPCPLCTAAMGVFESIDYVDGTSWWSGICGECGVRVEGERPERVEVKAQRWWHSRLSGAAVACQERT